MKNNLRLFLFLFFNVLHSKNVFGCSEVFTEHQLSGTGKFDCHSSSCWVRIDPNPTKPVYLNLQKHGSKLDVSVFSATSNETIPLTIRSDDTNDDTFLLEPNQGFLLNWKQENCSTSSPPEFNFARRHVYENCGFSFNFIEKKVKIIQEGKIVRTSFTCKYYLKSLNPHRETLYLLSERDKTLDVTYDDNENNKQTGKIIVLKNWTSIDLHLFYQGHERRSYYYHNSDGEVVVDKIIGATTNTSCFCNNKNIVLSSDEKIELQSPGYPDFLCPSVECETFISFTNPNKSEEYFYRALMAINATSKEGVLLSLNSETVDIRLDPPLFAKISTNFLIEQSKIRIKYTTPKTLYIGSEGHYKMTIQNIKLRKECDCSLFNNKEYQYDDEREILIPSICETMYCDWAIVPYNNRKRELSVKLDSGHGGDEVHIWNNIFMEKYNATKLKQSRKLYLSDPNSKTHVFFRRSSKGPDSIMHVKWTEMSDTGCPSSTTTMLSTTPEAFISPNYPMRYQFFRNCSTFLKAPKKHFITITLNDFDVENIHDQLRFYDGNSTTSSMIKHLTGIQANVTISSSGNEMLVDFFSDGFHGRRGYHFLAVAVPDPNAVGDQKMLIPLFGNFTSLDTVVPRVLESNATNNIELSSLRRFGSKKGYGFFHYLMGAVVIVGITVVVVVGILFFRKRTASNNSPNSFSNEMVRFRNEDNDSVATIGNDA